MPERPAIPAEVARQVLIESGHRCAVCGSSTPIERAHIVPWHSADHYTAENLVCLCANCHSRVDKEKWGKKVLREYKERPWVIRSRHREQNSPAHVEIVIEVQYDDFTASQRSMLVHGLAGFLGVKPDSVHVSTKSGTDAPSPAKVDYASAPARAQTVPQKPQIDVSAAPSMKAANLTLEAQAPSRTVGSIVGASWAAEAWHYFGLISGLAGGYTFATILSLDEASAAIITLTVGTAGLWVATYAERGSFARSLRRKLAEVSEHE